MSTIAKLMLILSLTSANLSSAAANPTATSAQQLASAAQGLNPAVTYLPSYVKIAYPNGDVPADTGVCTDVIIRSYRRIGIDLQVELHQDIKQHFSSYPSNKIWGLNRPDSNIDHRRVPNLETFFSRNGRKLPISSQATDYQPGEIVSWRLDNGLPHIGIVVNLKSTDKQRYLIMHNIGAGQVMEDVLFNWKITGHYLYPSNGL